MTGIEEARAWLAENGDGWEIQRAETRIAPGPFIGSPTEARCEVVLIRRDLDDVYLTGEGRTILEAAQWAVGHAR